MIKVRTFCLCVGLAFVLVLSVHIKSNAENRDFFCESDKDPPVTIAQTERGKKTIIRWVSTKLYGNLTPQERCKQVSEKFQAAQNNQRLNYLVADNVNRQQVICISDKRNGNCKDILMTLKPGSDAKKVLRELLDLRGLANGKAIEEGEDKKINIDFLMYLERTPVDSGLVHSRPSTSESSEFKEQPSVKEADPRLRLGESYDNRTALPTE
jgi:Circadian oscillating protein COP23